MATTSPNGGQAAEKLPQLNVLTQYVKDLSFENPNAPNSLAPTQPPPSINLQVNVEAKPLKDADYEVGLKIEGKAETSGNLLFQFELVYAGVFRIQNIPPENMQLVMLVECPRLLFPFAREIITTAVLNGGFPPLRLDPIDFFALFRQQMAQAPAQPPPPPAA